ncbi:BTAD domain-containing putative transcriptional regulator [Kribbella sp. NPDC026596]|uniref:AfsR/SARP family transcriptional regulator n=1 Tax=Kribbella sp. NPDC026596 TaxID=3155122 RepID=UPI0033ED6176
MEFRLLGPVQIWSEGERIGLKRRQERLLLAVLLLEPAKAVPAERLIELLWPEAMPANPRRALQVYISRLRTVLDVELTSGREGYAIQTPLGTTDIEQFRSLVEQARRHDDLEQRSKLLTDALALWRGPALADVTTEDVRRRLCRGLEEARWAAEELRLATELALGHHQELLPALAELTAAQPTRESFAAASMLALYRSGRQADALAVHAELVRHLDEELGVEPGTEVRDLQVAILRQDPALELPTGSQVPRELPADIGLLVGRDDVLTELCGVLLGAVQPGVPAVVCLYGAAGTGKSAAAVRLGHQLADSYPDGQLFARLQDVDGQGAGVRTLLGQLLRSLGADGGEIPDAVEARSALLRSRLADKRVLLVFDDALDAGQLRPLLPAGGGCGVIVTSRQPMLGLEDATHRELTPLSDATSAELLGALSGIRADRVTDVVPHCAGLPLALRIVGARLALIREDVADVVKTLADESQRLDYLVAGDRAVRASLDLTLSVATAQARQLFARLALVGADEFAPWVAAPLLGLTEPAATAVFDTLVSLGLVQPRRLTPPRYGLHGLVRALSIELLSNIEAEQLGQLEQRYLETVLRLVHIADAQVDHAVTTRADFDPGDEQLLHATVEAAGAGAGWFDIELPVLQAAVDLGVRRWPRMAGLLGVRLHGFLAVRDHREARQYILQTTRDATAASGDVDLEAELNRGLFAAYAQSGGLSADELTQLAERCLDSAERAGDVVLRVRALNQVAWAAGAQGDFGRKLDVAEQMLALAESSPEAESTRLNALDQRSSALHSLGRMSEAQAIRREICAQTEPGSRLHAIRLVMLGESLLGDADLGAAHLAELTGVIGAAREIVERIGDELGGAHVDNIEAMALIAADELEPADALLRRAADIFAQRPDDWGEGMNAVGRARSAFAAGRPGEARRILCEAVRSDPRKAQRSELDRQLKLLGLGSRGPEEPESHY